MRRLLWLLVAGMILSSAPLSCQTAAASEGDRVWQALRPLAVIGPARAAAANGRGQFKRQ